jgi:hypothetical protein
MATADSLERIARKKASSSKKETDFQAASKKQQEAFDRAAYVAKSQSASKKNVAKKGEALSGFIKNAIFDWTSPEMMALSVLPFGIGKVAGAGAKAAPKVTAVNNMIPQPMGYSPSTRIDGVGGAAEIATANLPASMFSIRSIPSPVRSNPVLSKYAPYGPTGGISFPATPIVTPKTEKMPIDQLLGMASKETNTAGNRTIDSWVKSGAMSQKQMDDLIKSISERGVKSPLQLDNVRGTDVLINGHHRLIIAKMLGLKELPIIR